MNLSGLTDSVNDIAISPNNQHIIAVDQMANAYLCLHPQYYYSLLKNNPPEDFTAEEKEKYAIMDTPN